MHALVLENLAVRIGGRWVLAHVNGAVPAGAQVLLTGDNGAGKTTLLRLMATLLRPSRGTITLFDEGIGNTVPQETLRRRLTLMTHQHHFYEALTGAQNLALVGRLIGGIDAAQQTQLLAQVGLTSHAHRPVAGYSAGMKRRLALARTQLVQPELVLLDEPFGQLDGAGVALMQDAIAQMAARGATVVMATHDVARGAALCSLHWHVDADCADVHISHLPKIASPAPAAALRAQPRPKPKASARTQFMALMGKELALEGQARLRINALLPFGLLVLLLFSFAVGPAPALLRRLGPGFIWLALLLASVLSLGESAAVEREHDAQEGLRLLGVDASALYVAKACANTLFIFALGLVLTPVAIALYGTPLEGGLPALLGVLALGAGAISAPGTLFAALAGSARSRDILLPLLLFPMLVPGLLGAVRATTLVMLGDPMHELWGWVTLLGVFNLLYWLLCTLLYERVLEG